MSNKLFATVDAMPLAGKFAIHDTIKSYIESDEKHDQRHYLATTTFLVGMVAAHAYQAYMGFESLESHITYSTLVEDDPLTMIGIGIDTAYLATNALVAARQSHLVARVEGIRKKKHQRKISVAESFATQQHATEKKEVTANHNNRKMLSAAAFTLAGQLLFMGSYADANTKHHEVECINEATSYYDTYAHTHPDETLIPKKDYIDTTCD